MTTQTLPNPAAASPPAPRGSSFADLSADAFVSLGAMEGLFGGIVETRPADVKPEKKVIHWPGYLVSGVVAAVAYGIHLLPFAPFSVGEGAQMRHPVSAAIVAIMLGLLVGNLFSVPRECVAGCKRIIKKVIPIAIVLIGAELNLQALASIGLSLFAIIVASMVVAIASAYLVGRSLGLGHRVSLLIGAGTGICGNSAIVAVAPLIDAEDDELVLSIGTVNLFGLVAMLLLPLVGGALALGSNSFGAWAGTTIHAVPQVVAAGDAFSADARTTATFVKLVRVALLAPLVFVLAMLAARRQTARPNGGREVIVHYARFVPWFVWGFALMALLRTAGLIPILGFSESSVLSDSWRELPLVAILTGAGSLLLTLAMAAIGLEVNLRLLAGVSSRAVLTGLISTIILAAVSFGLIALML